MSDSAASRLCAACGMCCNGVMFHSVKLQPKDTPQTLTALGLKLKVKKGQYSIQQPCPAHKACSCSIYLERPERCRAFSCRQILQLESGKTTEEVALAKILAAQVLVNRLHELFPRAGSKNAKHSFIARYEAVLAQPLPPQAEPNESKLRQELIDTYVELDALLKRDFRTAAAPNLPPL